MNSRYEKNNFDERGWFYGWLASQSILRFPVLSMIQCDLNEEE